MIKQKRRGCSVFETWAFTPNTFFNNHDDKSVGKTRLTFAVALTRFSHTETPPHTDSHTQTKNELSVVGLQVVKGTFLAEEDPQSRHILYYFSFLLTK